MDTSAYQPVSGLPESSTAEPSISPAAHKTPISAHHTPATAASARQLIHRTSSTRTPLEESEQRLDTATRPVAWAKFGVQVHDVSGADANEDDPKTLELLERLYTISEPKDYPRFKIRQIPTTRRRLDPIGNAMDYQTQEKHFPMPGNPPAVPQVLNKNSALKARKPVVVPTSSTHNRLDAQSGKNKGLSLSRLDHILRPPKRGTDELLVTEEVHFNIRSKTPVIPPIPSAPSTPMSPSSAPQSASATAPASRRTAKRVRMVEPDRDGQSESAPPEAEVPDDMDLDVSGSMTLAADIAQSQPAHRDPFQFIKYLDANPGTGEFVYMNRISDAVKGSQSTFNPYHLEIVDFSKVSPSNGYYTLSFAGVTHFDHQGHGDFTPLKQWLREYALFHSLLKIPFFARYRMWKCFTLWKRTVLHTKILFSKRRLSDNLFLVHPILRKTLLDVRACCADVIIYRRFVRIQEQHSYNLSEFEKEQVEWVESVGTKVLSALELDVRKLVEQAGVACLQEKGRSECRRIQRFVKLVDYMIVGTLQVMAIESTRDLLKYVYRGCKDADVVVDNASGAADPAPAPVVFEGETGASHDARDGEADSKRLEAPEGDAMEAESYIQRIPGVQVGGVVVGTEVGTSELIEKGFDGFPTILSRIVKDSMEHMELTEIIEDDGSPADIAEMEDETHNVAAAAPGKPEPAKAAKKGEKEGSKEKAHTFCPLFKTEQLIAQTAPTKHLYFNPGLMEYLTLVDNLIKLYLSTVEKVSLLSNTIPYLDPSSMSGGAYSSVRGFEETEYGEGPQVGNIIIENGYFREICGRIRGTLVGMFSNSTRWMQTWEEVRRMWIENENFVGLKALETAAGRIGYLLATSNSQSYEGGISAFLMADFVQRETEANQATGAPMTDPKDIDVLSLGANKQKMGEISTTSIINNLLIDTTNFKSVLTPSPERCFEEVAKILPHIARDKNDLLLGEVQTWVRILNTPPTSVEGFVEYLGWLEKVKNSMLLVECFYDEVSRLYNLMEVHHVPIQPTDLAMYQTLGPTIRQLKEAVDMASDTKEENITKFSMDLEKAVSDLMTEVSDIRNRAQDPMVLNSGAKSEVVIAFLEDLRLQLEKVEVLKQRYEMWGELFKSGGSIAEMQRQKAESGKQQQKIEKGGELEETKVEVELKRTLWVSLKDWDDLTIRPSRYRAVWQSGSRTVSASAESSEVSLHARDIFDSLNTEDISAQIQNYLKTVYNLDKGLPPNEVVPRLKSMVEEYRTMYPTIVDLRNPALKQRHWDKIQDALGKTLIKDETFTLGKLMELRVFEFKEEISNVSAQAGSEAALEEMLGRVVKLWNEAEFIVISYRDSKDVFILGAIDDIQTLLEDSQVTIATIKSSRFIGPIKAEVERWDKQLSLFAETLEAWMTCQRNWLYLESIFSAPDIQRQLPDEARMFSQVDRSWKDVMRKVSRNANAMKSGTMPGLLEMMQQNNVLLEQIQKCLEDYLESKRLLFPRFYFLSNEELLEILSQTRNPQAVQPHLSKCFDAIKSLEFSSADPKSIDIAAMVSPEGERVPFHKTIKARGNVEAWLGSVEEAMVAVLRRLIKTAIAEYEEPKRNDWIREHVGQVVLTGNQILWCKDITDVLKTADPVKGMVQVKQKCIHNLTNVAALVRGDLTKIQRAILGALITIDVHNRDIVHGLIATKCNGLGDFEWTKQQRYYWDSEADTCHVKMSSSLFNYGYEYLGCSPRLVITPLTDRCYLTLTGAMQLNLGGSPVGPAGTGKTETVKDLAKAMARQCVVFNCSDGMDYKMMGKMFAGLAQSGAWCCFDEFNRIDIEVLSVIAQQLLTIKNAKDMKALKFMFEGREIRLIETCTAFITMNPGYAGRTELPDNLKALFPTELAGYSVSQRNHRILWLIECLGACTNRLTDVIVYLGRADYGLIAEIMLFSEGFENAKVLSGKVVNLYKLCSEQLSQQDHYDFGMRAVKSVLIMAGALKRASPELSEEEVLIRSLRDSNLPKFLAEDVGLFKGILCDLFPGVKIVERDFGDLVIVIKEVMRERSLEVVDSFITRICQLAETMRIRHGVMLVGPTGGGKTTCYELLKESFTRIRDRNLPGNDYQRVKTWVLNPKASADAESAARSQTFVEAAWSLCVTMNELYGEFNLATMEWKDGLIGIVFRAQVQDTSPDEKWTVCDGPVDALWIENMNTVLDDNKLLTLINGERIKMTPQMHMLFEVMDLAVASPATVSRCGMVYMDPVDLGWRPFVLAWSRRLPEHIKQELCEYFVSLFDLYVDRGLRYVRKFCKEYIKSVNINLVASLCRLIQTFVNRRTEIDFSLGIGDLKILFSHIFVFCYVWALGGNLANGEQDGFDTFLRDMLETTPLADLQLPSSNNVFCYYIDIKTKGFALWDDIVPAFKYSDDIPYFQMIVPTTDTVKYAYLLEALLSSGYPTLFTGSTGVGKSIIVQDLLNRCSKKYGYVSVTLNFSAQTSSFQTQQQIELKLEKKRKNILGAPTGSNKLVLFVDDLNMPKLDTYGSQPPIELIRQYLDFGGFYDREKLGWTIIQDVEIVAACAPPGGGRNHVTPRLIRHFNLFSIPTPNEMSLAKIFRSIVEGFLKPFTSDVRSAGEAIVNSSIEIYHRMCTELLPTPAKSHYTFNMRDLSKVIQGILQVKPMTIQTRLDMAKLFCHESSRVFHDRLIDDTDRQYYNKVLSELVEKNFSIQIPKETLGQRPIMFGDFGKRGVPPEERLYVELADMKALNTLLEEYLEEYNVTMSKDVRLIFFLDAKQHITRIARIIRQPRGNALLVGVGGTGKQSLTRLACHMSDYQCLQIELTRTYGDVEWREDIKKVYRLAGVDGKNTVFLLSDTQIKQESFLEDINNILNSGEVPNLLEFDEREKVLGDLRPIAREKGLPEDRDSVYQFFISRVRDNLHIVLATSPVGDTFRNRCRMFPSLVNCCTIDWFDEWPKDALLSVSQRFFEFVDLGSEEMREKIASMCVDIHSSVGEMAKKFYTALRRKYYTTPTSYLELINLYVAMLQEKRKELGASRDRLKNGLNKLQETNDLVANMQIELEQLGPVLKQSAQDVEVLMVKIAKDQETADGVRKVVSEEEAIVREKAIATEAIAAEAQKDLDEALPALQSAYKALEALDKKDIAELKVFTKPPDAVLMVMESICLLFKVKPDWENSKKLLGDSQFMKKMQDYDKDNIPEAIQKKLQKYIQNPNFNPEAVERVSKACKSMCMWVVAMDLYSRVFKEVAPKRKRLEEAQQMLEATMAKLAEKTAALQEVESQLQKLKNKYETSIATKKQLSDKMEETTRRLGRASKLTLALADEQIRWTESVERLSEQIEALVGNIFLSSACVAYYGAFTSTYRIELVQEWVGRCKQIGIPVSDNFTLMEHLADPAVVRDWNIQGLPADELSIENGILVTRGRRWPLMIDPQGQANNWIRKMEGNELKIVKLSDSKFLRSLENAIRTGQPVLMEDVGEQLDPALEPLLLKQTVRQGGRLLMKLGDSFVEYDRNFKLYITTKLANPHYLPEVCIKVTIINFTVTKAGLEGQLLADVVKLERPELEEQRNSLIVNIANDKKQLKDIEEKILKLLFNSQGNILDDEELINTLNQSKVTSAAIKERVAQAEQTEKEINIARERYRPVAIRGSVLYFVIADLSEIDSMYQFSLKYFKNLFSRCIVDSEKSDDLLRRIEILCSNITFTIFSNVSRGLFEQHKMIYSFMICIEIMRERKQIDDTEWNFFLRGGGALRTELPPKPTCRWLSNYMWQNCCDLAASIPEYSYLVEHMSTYTSDWEKMVESDTPFFEAIPGDTKGNLSDFKKLILVRVLREEKLVQSVIDFLKRNIGSEFIDIPPLDLAKAFQDTNYQTPFIFILSTGSDPTAALMKFAASKDVEMQDRLHMISLGQGQGPIAEDLVRRALVSGDWVFLQNCHLAASWMTKLENMVKEFSSPEADIHRNFRLFLSSMPSKVFPTAVLQEGVKITNEPPKGLRANLARSFADISKDLFDEHPPQGVRFRKLLFGVCFFNAIIHERKKFGALGWNIMYDWSNSDLEVSIIMLRNLLQEHKAVAWDALTYLTGEITFGGRVTDDWDRRTLKSILAKYYNPQILEEGYKFSPSGVYYAPPDGDLASFRTYIESLPYTEEPSVFGMHENANISFQLQETRRLLKTVLDVQPRLMSAGGGKSSDQMVSDIATNILESWPGAITVEVPGSEGAIKDSDAPNSKILEEMFRRDEDGRMLNSLSTVLLQETVRFNKLNLVVRASLESLNKAVKGLVVMSSELEKVFRSLLNNEVPASWSAVSYPSLKPLGGWVKDFHKRVAELNQWIEHGQPASFWLSGFYFPQGFLTGVLQNHARKYNVPIDTLVFAYKVSDYEDGESIRTTRNTGAAATPAAADGSESAPGSSGEYTSSQGNDEGITYPDHDGVFVSGLFIEGARWDRDKRSLHDSFPMEMFSTMPLLRFIPTQIPQADSTLYVCPLYKTSARAGTLSTTGQSTNFIVSINLPTSYPPAYWIAKGVALLCQLDE
ncbi:dynein heavy chain and region D6 of dynein motor-domain-containing protein [Polychytrium aggregatum]|uniref:dynein heavy chain and region D6 of dynein motor-domain-containing protein n=1 Tax=Polychytrium aggregatum TaxID=110093 RepID=UPI0022FF3E9C|nr:dynein heavy chain and region D6 of dynein motor-domain-containing protein [Polychytrium aggregatum]KAI9203256.1 dynein heavy chain and region D6 of dynein motor-domain-containing protein [Polychytrium aggregatum]